MALLATNTKYQQCECQNFVCNTISLIIIYKYPFAQLMYLYVIGTNVKFNGTNPHNDETLAHISPKTCTIF